MPDKIKLPPGATLVDDGTQGMTLPPGATLAPAAQFPPTSMTDPSGQLQMVPHEQLAQKVQQGWKVGLPAQQGDLSASLPEVKQANQDYQQRGAFGKAMSWTLGTMGPDAERYANNPGAVESVQNAAENSAEQNYKKAAHIAGTQPDNTTTRFATGLLNANATAAGMVGSGAKILRGMATPSNAAAATAATFVPPLRLPIGAYYAVRGAMDTFTPQQPGETAPDAMERRLLGGASMAGGAAGAVSGFSPAATAVRGIASKAANTKLGQSAGIVAKPLAPVINDIPIVRGIAQGLKAVGDVPNQLNEVWNPGIKSQLLGPSETSTSSYGSFEPAPIGMADALPPAAPPARVPLWRGIASGKPPVSQPEPLPPATPRAAALAQSGPPRPSPTLATAQPQFISPDDVLSHITGEGKGFQLPAAEDTPLINANNTLRQFSQWKSFNDAINELNDPYTSPEELGWRYMQEAKSPGSWASQYPSASAAPEIQSPAAPSGNPVRGITQAPAAPAINEIEQAMAKSGTTATGDNQYFQQAKNMLGPKATTSEISQQAQKLKLQDQDPIGQLLKSIEIAKANGAAHR